MYRVLCDGLPIYDLRDEELVLFDPKAILEVNTAGSFDFKMPPKHPQYDIIKKMRSCVEIWHDEEQLFAGRPTSDDLDFYNRKNVKCEGQLAYLNDSIQRPAEYHDMTVRGYLEALIAVHNSQVDESRQFEVGIVTVKDNNDSLYRYTNYNSTWTEIKEDLIDDLGGYIRVRNHNGHRYIDYIEDFDNVCSQSIEFGENLLDCSRNTDLTDIATAVIPLGCRLEESDIAALEKRLTIESVNNGIDYIVNAEAVAKYGFIVKTVTWDDVTTPEMLLYKGKRWLESEQYENMVIDVKAVDLHYTDEQIEQFKLFDLIPVHSTPHGLNRQFPLSKMTINLNNPSANTFVLGTTVNTSLTSKSSAAQSTIKKVMETIPVPSAIVKQAVDQATALITAVTHGHVVTTANEQLIMNTADVNTATKVWRWNLNGLGYSGTGYNGIYKTAITMDGQIAGERLIGGSVSAEKLDITYRNQVIKEIADAEESARQDAEDYTNNQLKSYYTKSQIETTIKNLEDSVLLSAKETAEQYVDGRLKHYSTSAQVKVETDRLYTEVSKKTDSDQVNSLIDQKAESIRMMANIITWKAKNSSMDENGNLKCSNVEMSGVLNIEKEFEDYQMKGAIGKVSYFYNNESKIRTGFDLSNRRNKGYPIGSGKFGYFSIIPTLGTPVSLTEEEYTSFLVTEGQFVFQSQYQAGSLSNYYSNMTLGWNYFNIAFKDGIKRIDIEWTGDASLNGKWTIDGSSLWFKDLPVRTSASQIGVMSDNRVYKISSSSKRYKNHITDVSEELDPIALYNLPVKTYYYNDDYISDYDQNKKNLMIGFIAEDVDSIYPVACQYDDKGRPEMWNANIMIPAMLKLIQNLHEDVEILKGEL